MPITGYLKIPDIPGESLTLGHEGEIQVNGMSWDIDHSSPTTIGRGRARSRAEAGPLVVVKAVDKATPFLASAVARGTQFDEIVLSVNTMTGGVNHTYLKLAIQNCQITEAALQNQGMDDPLNVIRERIEIAFETLTITYFESSTDGSAAHRHEVEVDLVTGV